MSDSRDRILDAAAALVVEGVEAPTVERVAERAGVSRATVYRRFGDRDGLLRALSEERAVDVADTRTRILEAAAVEFWREGINGASIAAIAERAGVQPQSVYNHFGDKETLLTELLAAQAPSAMRSAAAAAAAGDPQDAIRAFVHSAVRLSREHHDLLSTVIVPDQVTRRAFRRSVASTGEAGDMVAQALRHVDLPEGMDAEFAAISLMGLVVTHATLQPALTGVDPGDPQELADRIADLFLRAIDAGE